MICKKHKTNNFSLVLTSPLFTQTHFTMDSPTKMFSFMLSCMAFMFSIGLVAGTTKFVAGTRKVGLNYGLLGDNLPTPAEVINLYESLNISKIRIFDTNTDVLNAFRRNRNIGVIVGVKNQDLQALAVSQEAVNTWFLTNIEPYLADVNITYITVGNEVIPGEIGAHVLAVTKSLTNLVKARSLPILISTTVAMTNLGKSYPASSGEFTHEARAQLVPVLKYLSHTNTPILVNIYPYFAYAAEPANIRLDYATFDTNETVVQDGPLGYSNMFDVIFDAFVWAMEREGVKNLPMVVAETGWPSAGNGNMTTPEIACKYNGNFVKHVDSGKGTPKRPNSTIDGYLFATFNENQKPAGTEQNFGLYYPTGVKHHPLVMKPVYNLF